MTTTGGEGAMGTSAPASTSTSIPAATSTMFPRPIAIGFVSVPWEFLSQMVEHQYEMIDRLK